MVIQHNIAALNAYRQLNTNTSAVGKNLEKLSSGYAINRAGDDASGLAISEKMRAQISGLQVAQKNAQDGISLVQTAEGALTEVHSMLNRMTELAEKSGSGTVQDNVDREAIQKEVNDLVSEIDRISQSTNFNGIQLLDGSLSSSAKATSATGNGAKATTVSGVGVTLTNNEAVKDEFVTRGATAAATVAGTGTVTVNYLDKDGSAKSKEVSVTIGGTDSATVINSSIATAINSDEDLKALFTATGGDGTADTFTIEAKTAGTQGGKVTSISMNQGAAVGVTPVFAESANTVEGADPSGTISISGITATTDGSAVDVDGTVLKIGDKTYELLNDVSKVKDGNIAVKVGTTGGATIDNLVTALKANGVSSAAAFDSSDADTDSEAIKITDLTQVATAQKGAKVTSDSIGVAINNTAAVAGVYTQAMATASSADGSNQTLTISYIDESGAQKAKDISYTTGADRDATAAAINEAIGKDETLSKLFTTKYDATTHDFTITAKTEGTSGAQLISMKTTDSATNAAFDARTITTEAKDAGKDLELTDDLKAGDTVTVDGKTFEFVKNVGDVQKGNVGVVMGSTTTDTAKNLAASMKSENVDMSFDPSTGKISFKDDAAATTEQGGLTLLIGDSNASFQKVAVSIDDLSSKGLGLDKVDVSTREAAGNAIQTIKDAINKVSTNRGNLGGLQNRLEYTINNLSVTEENMTAAESSIRDVDMASEMMAYTKNNVLTQAAQAMLAQANTQPQSVLQLLQ